MCRHSMPCMAASSSARLNTLRAADRLYSRPAPCGEEFSDSRLPFPVTTYDRVPIEPGMRPG